MNGGEILFSIASGLAINECCEISPWAARRLVRWAARHRYTSVHRAEIRAEEHAQLIDELPGKLFKLATAVGFAACATTTGIGRALARRTPEKAMRYIRKLGWRVRAPLPVLLTKPQVTFLDTSAYGNAAIERRVHLGFVNDLECQWVLAACRRIHEELPRRAPRPAVVCVLACYRAQAQALRRLLETHRTELPALRFQVIGTPADALGLESDYAIVSFCRASRSPRSVAGFLLNPARLYIAATRPRRGLILIGHGQTLRRIRGPVGELLDHLLDDSPDGATVLRNADLWSCV